MHRAGIRFDRLISIEIRGDPRPTRPTAEAGIEAGIEDSSRLMLTESLSSLSSHAVLSHSIHKPPATTEAAKRLARQMEGKIYRSVLGLERNAEARAESRQHGALLEARARAAIRQEAAILLQSIGRGSIYRSRQRRKWEAKERAQAVLEKAKRLRNNAALAIQRVERGRHGRSRGLVAKEAMLLEERLVRVEKRASTAEIKVMEIEKELRDANLARTPDGIRARRGVRDA